MVPAAFVRSHRPAPVAWDGVLSFWLKDIVIAAWIVVMGTVLGRAIRRERRAG